MQHNAPTVTSTRLGQPASQKANRYEKANQIPEGVHFRAVRVQDIKQGEFVRKIRQDGSMQTKTYQRGAYDRVSKRYSLTDCDDVNREVFVNTSVLLAVDFTY